jgi:hypothetical protein
MGMIAPFKPLPFRVGGGAFHNGPHFPHPNPSTETRVSAESEGEGL